MNMELGMNNTANNNEVVIEIDNIKKQYRLGTIGGGTLKGDLQSWWARVRKKEDPNTKIGSKVYAKNEKFMALNGVSFDVKKGEFYLSEVIGRVRNYYGEKLSGTEFTIAEYPDCLINGDPDRLAEVMKNIIENAIKYGDGQYIRISFSDEENFRLVTVANSGCTLPEEELVYIFDSFRRGSNSADKKGSGLGLYICRCLMTAMDGDIFAEIRGGEMRVTAVCRMI